MQKVIHVSYSSDKATEKLEELNSYLEQGWTVVLTQPVRQYVSCDNGCVSRG